jgi:SAM-dependent methyltransferase
VGLWGERILPRLVDRALSTDEVNARRQLPCQGLRGRVLEIGRAGLDGERLDLADGSVDAALSTYTHCTIPDVQAALLEVRRVLRPGGRLHFVEHGRAPEPSVQRSQHRIHPLHTRLAGGCHLDRPIDRLIVDAGFILTDIDRGYGTGPRWASFIYRGRAVPE